MSDNQMLDTIRELLAESMLSGMFGDGMEREYVRDGTDIRGTYQMSEREVIEGFLSVFDGEDLPEVVWANKRLEELPKPVKLTDRQRTIITGWAFEASSAFVEWLEEYNPRDEGEHTELVKRTTPKLEEIAHMLKKALQVYLTEQEVAE